MAASLQTAYFTAHDGIKLAWHEIGDGIPLVLLHGLFSSASVNWIQPGHAAFLAQAGFRVIMPDLRGHGESGYSPSPSWPKAILTQDCHDLIDHLGLQNWILGGYSLGARISAHFCLGKNLPKKLILAGMGLTGLTDIGLNLALFKRALGQDRFPQGSSERFIQSFLRQTGCNKTAMLALLESQFPLSPDEISQIAVTTLVLSGEKDRFNGSPLNLKETLPDAMLAWVPGDHMSAVGQGALAVKIADFVKKP
ncbi:MAG: alpha/beta hydrolase [Zymomonas mobilis]|uniref:Alpha/beta hydrolase family protein n=1 Tax=Zymomonas mobilis TaxID=542 RepID=A0A542W2D9_ZYMMB|nr:alpha/beta hydrolase [Zymomonas mobilis]TQL17737.1 alpha/beta hydrolase family protein [Zymomonas mobilis]